MIMIICSILIAIRGLHDASADGKGPAAEHAEAEIDSDDDNVLEKEIISKKQINQRIMLFIGAVLLFAILMNYLNFLIVSFLFLLVSMILLSRQKMIVSLIVSVIFSVIFYYVFAHVFHIVFPS
ncbi:hypothetical protein SD71_01125 [Cohnella kolymensis]|uniref:DUF1468 domain-containing protein n=1 Tax=Cohnella kolymensis TaxID=1590652 RepID=A0ABR5A8J3_9BACL|nr:hypothetical protein SD71_01125 [Cohnella kolymensis]